MRRFSENNVCVLEVVSLEHSTRSVQKIVWRVADIDYDGEKYTDECCFEKAGYDQESC